MPDRWWLWCGWEHRQQSAAAQIVPRHLERQQQVVVAAVDLLLLMCCAIHHILQKLQLLRSVGRYLARLIAALADF